MSAQSATPGSRGSVARFVRAYFAYGVTILACGTAEKLPAGSCSQFTHPRQWQRRSSGSSSAVGTQSIDSLYVHMPTRTSSDASLAASIGVLLYMNTLRNSFVFDDHRAIERNPCVRPGEGSLLDGAYWQRLLSTDFWGTPLDSPRSHHSYRPLSVLSLRLDALLTSTLLSQRHPPPQLPSAAPLEFAAVTHAINAAMHGATTWLLWWHAHHGLTGRSAPLLAALLFALHPVNTEAVAYGVGRADVLSAFLGLAGLLLHRLGATPAGANGGAALWRLGPWLGYRFLAACSLLLALAAKETAAVLLLACASTDVLGWICSHSAPSSSTQRRDSGGGGASELSPSISQRQRRLRGTTRRMACSRTARLVAGWAPLILLGGGFVWLRAAVAGPIVGRFRRLDNPIAFANSTKIRVLSCARVQLLGLGLLVWPAELSADYSFDAVPLVESWAHPAGPVALCVYTAAAMLVIRLLALARSAAASSVTRRRASMGLCWAALLGLGLAPASHALVPLSFVVAERLLYLPCAAACLLASAALQPPYAPPMAEGLTRGAQHAPEGGRRRRCAPPFTSAYRRARRLLALVALVLSGARTMTRTLDWRDDDTLFAAAAAVYPRSAKASYQLADGLVRRGQLREAMPMLRKVISIEPTYHYA